jgi:hypothetical protein
MRFPASPPRPFVDPDFPVRRGPWLAATRFLSDTFSPAPRAPLPGTKGAASRHQVRRRQVCAHLRRGLVRGTDQPLPWRRIQASSEKGKMFGKIRAPTRELCHTPGCGSRFDALHLQQNIFTIL